MVGEDTLLNRILCRMLGHHYLVIEWGSHLTLECDRCTHRRIFPRQIADQYIYYDGSGQSGYTWTTNQSA